MTSVATVKGHTAGLDGKIAQCGVEENSLRGRNKHNPPPQDL